jgi:hypothetical protein
MSKKYLKPLLLFAAMMLMATTACAHTKSSQQESVEPPDLLEHREIFPADTIEVMSQAMGRTIKNVVVRPSTV